VRYLAEHVNIYWFVIPLVVSISLVYAASRYESWHRIWAKALSLCTMILALMALTTIILLLINTQV
jgi:hypothetical protein